MWTFLNLDGNLKATLNQRLESEVLWFIILPWSFKYDSPRKLPWNKW